MATACSNIKTSFNRLSDFSRVTWAGNDNALEQCHGVMYQSCWILGQFSGINFMHKTRQSRTWSSRLSSGLRNKGQWQVRTRCSLKKCVLPVLVVFLKRSYVCVRVCVCVCVWVCVLGHIQLFVTPGTVTCQTPLSMGFPRQEYGSGFPFPTPQDLPNPTQGSNPRLLWLLH